jgi:SET domain-containing protein
VPEGNLSQYICHSCEPNLGIKERTLFVAMRDIKKGEEVVIDYAMIVPEFPEPAWDGWEDWKCSCGRVSCRGKVKGYNQLSKQEQEKYKGYVSDFLL